MHKRMKLVNERGKQILTVDLSHCTPGEVEIVARAIPDYVTTRPLCSVLLLIDFEGASVDLEAVRAMKETAVFDKPYIKKSAWIGASDFPKEAHEEIGRFSGRELPAFKAREEALTWLVGD